MILNSLYCSTPLRLSGTGIFLLSSNPCLATAGRPSVPSWPRLLCCLTYVRGPPYRTTRAEVTTHTSREGLPASRQGDVGLHTSCSTSMHLHWCDLLCNQLAHCCVGVAPHCMQSSCCMCLAYELWGNVRCEVYQIIFALHGRSFIVRRWTFSSLPHHHSRPRYMSCLHMHAARAHRPMYASKNLSLAPARCANLPKNLSLGPGPMRS